MYISCRRQKEVGLSGMCYRKDNGFLYLCSKKFLEFQNSKNHDIKSETYYI